MAAAVPIEPTSPASAYRPLRFKVSRADPSGAIIDEVFIADSADVSALGNGLNVGDVVIRHTSIYSGPIPAIAGQTIILDSDMGPYAGVQMVTNAFTDGGDNYMVIDALDQGDFTPASAFVGSFKVWLNNYTVHCRVLVYTDPAEDPQIVDLKAEPDPEGDAYFHVDIPIRDYFNHRIETFMGDVPGGGYIQDAHGVTALFYRVHIAEVYDVPGDTSIPNPFDGTHTILEDDTDDVGTFRVAVNAVHPYAGTIINWTTDGFSDFVPGSSSKRFLTNAPRTITLGREDHFRLHMLTDAAAGHLVDLDIRIGVPAGANIQNVVLSDPTSAFSLACGPADIFGIFPTATTYTIQLRVTGELTVLSETITFNVLDKCSEGDRKFGWTGKLGGVDLFTFRGRETTTSRVKRATVRKPYGSGTGYDWTERPYRAEPERTAVTSTQPMNADHRKWLVRDFFESANTNTIEEGQVCPCTLLTNDNVSGSTGPLFKPVTVEYRLGVDNLTQQA